MRSWLTPDLGLQGLRESEGAPPSPASGPQGSLSITRAPTALSWWSVARTPPLRGTASRGSPAGGSLPAGPGTLRAGRRVS